MNSFSKSQKNSGTFSIELHRDHAILRTRGEWDSQLVELLTTESLEELEKLPRIPYAVITDHQEFQQPSLAAMDATNRLNKMVSAHFPKVTYAMVSNPEVQELFRELARIQNIDTGIELAFFDHYDQAYSWLIGLGFEMGSEILQRIDGSHFLEMR